jgi:ribose-phosphate pyrophosphokinase
MCGRAAPAATSFSQIAESIALRDIPGLPRTGLQASIGREPGSLNGNSNHTAIRPARRLTMTLILPFPNDLALGQYLARKHRSELGTIDWHRFPDQESLITLQGDCRQRDVIIVCTLSSPDMRAMPLYFAAMTARELGARSLGLLAPYLGYMRQDHRFAPGQSRNAYCFGNLLSSTFDWLAAVDPHLHRIRKLDEIYSIPARTIHSLPAISEWIRSNVADPLLIGPDAESAQWVEPVAATLAAPCIVLNKLRHGDCDVSVSALDPESLRGRHPVVLDDIASSGQTMLEVLKQLARLRALPATCIAVHSLLSDAAENALRAAGADRIVSTNTVAHSTNAIDVNPLIAAELAAWGRL